MKLTSTYILGEGEGGVSQSYSYGNMQSFKIVAYFLLVCTDSGGYVKFTLKYTEFFVRLQSYLFGNSGPHAKFQNRSLLPSGLY